MRQIFVEPERLEQIAGKIEQAGDDYKRLYQSLLAEVDKLSLAWSGKDNRAFVEQIEAYGNDFRQMAVIISQYVEFLRNSSRAYRETQDELYAQAQKLYR